MQRNLNGSLRVFRRLAQASLENTSIEDVCENYEGCSADTVQYRLKKMNLTNQFYFFIKTFRIRFLTMSDFNYPRKLIYRSNDLVFTFIR